jgi:diguanylate cyclase (GGDEF)-like protein/PAS domain S-box-containing protein
MAELHRLVQRQMRRIGVTAETPPDAAQWAEMLERVSTAYTDGDQAQYIDKRALDLSSQEMRDLYDEHRRSEARLTAVFDAVDVGLCVVDTFGVIETVNPVLAAAARRPAADLIGQTLWNVVRVYDADDAVRHKPIVDDVLVGLVTSSGASWSCDDVTVDHGEGAVFPAAASLTPLVVDHYPAGAVMVVQDISERKRAEADLQWQATHDQLTGLPNGAHFMDLLSNALRDADRDVSILYCDLDHFKEVNDTFGHSAGDQLLARAGARIRAAVRERDIVARLSGDEFAVLSSSDGVSAARVGERLIEVLNQPFAITSSNPGEPERFANVSASVGVATASPMSTPAQLLGDADAAMYLAKHAGRCQVQVFGQCADYRT